MWLSQTLHVDDDFDDDDDDNDDVYNGEDGLYDDGYGEEDELHKSVHLDDEKEESDMDQVRAMIAQLEASTKGPSPRMQGPSQLYQSFSARVDGKPHRPVLSETFVLPPVMRPTISDAADKGSCSRLGVSQTGSSLPSSNVLPLAKTVKERSAHQRPTPSQKAVKPTPTGPSRKISNKLMTTYADYQKTHYQNLEHVYLAIAGMVVFSMTFIRAWTCVDMFVL